jgi:hypothetical protein
VLLALTQDLGHADLVVVIGKRTVVPHVLAARMQVQHEAAADVDVGTDIEVAAAFAVRGAEQVGQRVRILDIGRTVAQLAVQFEGVGVRVQAVVRIVVIQAADVVSDVRIQIAFFTAIDIPLQVAAAAQVLRPLDAGQPGARVQAGRVVHVVGAALQGRIETALGQAAVAVFAGQRGVEADFVLRLLLLTPGHADAQTPQTCGQNGRVLPLAVRTLHTTLPRNELWT